MKIEDLNLKIGDKLPYNVVEDLCVFMKNHPNFYRKEVYPRFVEVQDAVKNGGKFDKKSMLPMIEKACKQYVQEYNIQMRPETLLTDGEKMECVSNLLKAELENFRNKEY